MKKDSSIDFSYMNELASFLDEPDTFLKERILSFLDILPDELRELQSIIKSKNYSLLVDPSHRLANSCAIVGAHKMKLLCESLEKESRVGNQSIIEDVHNKLEYEANLVNSELKTFLQSVEVRHS